MQLSQIRKLPKTVQNRSSPLLSFHNLLAQFESDIWYSTVKSRLYNAHPGFSNLSLIFATFRISPCILSPYEHFKTNTFSGISCMLFSYLDCFLRATLSPVVVLQMFFLQRALPWPPGYSGNIVAVINSNSTRRSQGWPWWLWHPNAGNLLMYSILSNNTYSWRNVLPSFLTSYWK